MTLRIGVIGAGWVGAARHVPGFRSHPEAEVVSVFDRKPERAAAIAQEHKIGESDSDLERFFERGLDLVSIATPPWTHADLASMALSRGVHVFSEKPMAMSFTEARGMVEAANSADRLLCVSHNFLYSRAARKAETFLGPAPSILYAGGIQLSSSRRRLPTWHRRLPLGLLFDEMPHLIYLLQHFVGQPMEVDHVRGTQDREGRNLKAVEMLVRGPRGPGQATMVLDSPVSEWQVVLVTKRGTVALDLFRDIAIRVRPDGAHRPLDILGTSLRAMTDHAAGFVGSGMRYLPGRLFWGHDVLIRAFVDAVIRGDPSPVSHSEALGVVSVADRVIADLGAETPA
jgi:predicted dehydrogenase